MTLSLCDIEVLSETPVTQGAAACLAEVPAEDILAFVERVARRAIRQHGAGAPMEDLVAFGVLGFLEAAQRYDSSSGTSLVGFAYFRTYGAIVDGMRRWSMRRRSRGECGSTGKQDSLEQCGESQPRLLPSHLRWQVSLDDDSVHRMLGANCIEGTNKWSGGEVGIASIVEGCSAHANNRLAWRNAVDAMASLPEQDQRLLDLLYRQNKTLSEVAAALGSTRSSVARRHHAVLARLRRRLDDPFTVATNIETAA